MISRWSHFVKMLSLLLRLLFELVEREHHGFSLRDVRDDFFAGGWLRPLESGLLKFETFK